MLSSFVGLFSFNNYLFPFFIIWIAHSSMLKSIPISCLYILIVCIRVFIIHLFFANSWISSIYIQLFIFFFVIFKIVCRVDISLVYNWMALLLYQLKIAKVSLLRKCLFKFLVQVYFQVLTILKQVSILNINLRKVMIICLFLWPLLGDIFQSHWYYFP